MFKIMSNVIFTYELTVFEYVEGSQYLIDVAPTEESMDNVYLY